MSQIGSLTSASSQYDTQKRSQPGIKIHTVAQGDTLSSIARQYDETAVHLFCFNLVYNFEALQEANPSILADLAAMQVSNYGDYNLQLTNGQQILMPAYQGDGIQYVETQGYVEAMQSTQDTDGGVLSQAIQFLKSGRGSTIAEVRSDYKETQDKYIGESHELKCYEWRGWRAWLSGHMDECNKTYTKIFHTNAQECFVKDGAAYYDWNDNQVLEPRELETLKNDMQRIVPYDESPPESYISCSE